MEKIGTIDSIPNLSIRERMVLAGIIQNPSLADIEIASNIKVKHSTFATIKKRLYKKNYFKYYYIPNMTNLGAELFSININHINESLKQAEINGYIHSIVENLEFLNLIENIFVAILETNVLIIASLNKNYTDFSNLSWKFDNIYMKKNIIFNFNHEINFSLRCSTFPRFFDFSRSISHHLKLKRIDIPFKIVFKRNISPLKFSKLGWKIFLSFLKYPGSPPQEIARLIDKPRTTTTRWLRYFIQNELLIPCIIPNVTKLGYSTYFILHITIHSFQNQIINYILERIDKLLVPIILIRSNHNVFFISLFSSIELALESEIILLKEINTKKIDFKINYRNLLSISHTFVFTDIENPFERLVSQYYSDIIEKYDFEAIK